LEEISDGLPETAMIVEVSPDKAVHWMAPQDNGARFLMSFGTKTKLDHEGGSYVAFGDGHVEFIDVETPTAERRAMLTISGNDGPDR
jgi:prepilin-type processing-associated H-X9-DG protein